jgi:hypothetical protein
MSPPNIVEVISCGFMLYLSLASVTYAAASATKPGAPNDAVVRVNQADPCGERSSGQPNLVKCDGETHQGIRTITGEVLHINGARLLVKQSDGEEVILHIDLSTLMGVRIGPGSRIEAKVNEVERERYVLAINKAR